jgi:Protein of unknown function (DUF2723)
VDRSVAQGRRIDPIDPRRLAPALAVGVVAFAAFVAARSALLPGVAFWDTGEFQTVGPLLGTAHPTGFPTYVLLGWLASVVLQPFGDAAFRMNLLSAICVAVAAGVTVDLVRSLTGSIALGVAAGIGLALTPIVWAIGTRADPHALHLALFAILLRVLVGWEERVRDGRPSADRWLVAATVVVGLAMGNHSLTLLLGLPIAVYVLVVEPGILRRPRLVLTCVAALAITLVIVYLELPLRAGPFRAPLVYGRPETWAGFWYVVLAEQFRGSLVDPFGDLPGKFRALVDLTVSQFGILAAFIPIGLVATSMRRPNYALLTGLSVAVTCFFAASYENADIHRYYLGPILVAWTWIAILAGVAAEGAAVLMGGRVPDDEAVAATPSIDRRPAGTALLAGFAAILLIVPTLFAAPARYEAVDRSGDRTTAAWLDRVLARLEPDAVVVSWWSFSTPLWYAQRVEGRRPDIVIADDRTRLDEDLGSIRDVIDANLGRRPVYLLRENLSAIPNLEQLYDIETIDEEPGLFIRVLRHRDAA